MPALAVGGYTPVHTDDHVLVYERSAEGQRMRVALNLSHVDRQLEWPERHGQVLLSTYLDREGEIGPRLDLRADEGVLIQSTMAP